MRRIGAILGGVASTVFLAILLLPYLPETFRDLELYYGFGTVSPVLAGVLSIGIVAALVTTVTGDASVELGAGVALGLSLAVFLITLLGPSAAASTSSGRPGGRSRCSAGSWSGSLC